MYIDISSYPYIHIYKYIYVYIYMYTYIHIYISFIYICIYVNICMSLTKWAEQQVTDGYPFDFRTSQLAKIQLAVMMTVRPCRVQS